MKRWLVVSIALAVNAGICFMAIAPALATWVHAAPQYIKCANCGTPEVQEALAAAVDVGRLHVLSIVRSFSWPIIALCIANLALVVAAGWRKEPLQPHRPRTSSG
jgi:hypothetical protein